MDCRSPSPISTPISRGAAPGERTKGGHLLAGPGAFPLRPAWELPSKYQPLRVIGTGHMGTVLLARDLDLRRLVAVKLLRTDRAECPDFLDRLQSEARILARLEHPSIVRVYELDVQAVRPFLVMEYWPGGSLAFARLEPVPLVRMLRGVVDALAHAHAQGIVHRDVKPENVLLAALGPRATEGHARAILTDFGLAIDAGEQPGAPRPVVGTPLTMSPEQVTGAPVGPASDIFSFGVTLYRKLTGAWPFRGRTVIDVFDAILHREPEPLRVKCRNVPRRLQAIVQRSLAKDPAARFGTMVELGVDLDRFLRFRSLIAQPRAWFAVRRAETPPAGPYLHPEELR